MNKSTRYSPEVRERAVRLVFEHEREYSSQWSAIQSIAGKIGCSAETLRRSVDESQSLQANQGSNPAM
jgi:transposase-like protein